MKYICFVFGLFLCLTAAHSKPISPPKMTLPLWTLLLDAKDSGLFPRRFRTTRDDLFGDSETEGLMDLNMSGSAQFSVLQLKAMIDKIGSFGVSPNLIVVVDLRGEPHGFINDYPVMWYAQGAWWTQSDPLAKVLADEKKHLASLSVGENILLKRIALKDEIGKPEVIDNFTDKISSLHTEEQVVKAAGAHYIRIPVTDHMRPEDDDVDMFLHLIKTLPPGVWVHFHCHGGHGRTSTFMIMYDIIRNPNLSEKEIIDRQVKLGSLDVRHVSNSLKKSYKIPDQESRLRFVNLFYKFVHAPDGYGKKSWTNWITQQYGKSDGQYDENNTFRHSTVASAAGQKS